MFPPLSLLMPSPPPKRCHSIGHVPQPWHPLGPIDAMAPSRCSSCDADYILMLDGVMEYNHASLQLATGRSPATARTLLDLLSSPLSALLLCTGEFHFILRFQSGFRLCEYSTDRSCSPTRLPDHPPAPPYPLYPPPFTLQPPSSPPSPWSWACGLSVCISEVAPRPGELM